METSPSPLSPPPSSLSEKQTGTVGKIERLVEIVAVIEKTRENSVRGPRNPADKERDAFDIDFSSDVLLEGIISGEMFDVVFLEQADLSIFHCSPSQCERFSVPRNAYFSL